MKVLVTGVAGQLGHDVMNELAKRGIEGISSDIADTYSGADDGTAVTTMRYVPIDLTDGEAVQARIIFECMQRIEDSYDVHFHRLCIQWSGHRTMETGLHRLRTTECIRQHEACRRTGCYKPLRQVFHCPYCLGIWYKWQELYQDYAECWQKP